MQVLDPKCKKTAQAVSATKQRGHGNNTMYQMDMLRTKMNLVVNFSVFSSRALKDGDSDKDTEGLIMLLGKLDDLHRPIYYLRKMKD